MNSFSKYYEQKEIDVARELVEDGLKIVQKIRSPKNNSYLVPEFLLGDRFATELVDVGSPYDFFAELLSVYLRKTPRDTIGDAIYSCDIPTFSTLNKEQGSALKQIAFLNFLQVNFDVGKLILLPITSRGRSHKKGDTGSPFAVRDHFKVSDIIADQLLPDISAEFQYRLLMACCILGGIIPGSILPLTTIAVDAPVLARRPDLTFWWDGQPEELLFPSIYDSFEDLAKSSKRFSDPPNNKDVYWMHTNKGNKLADKRIKRSTVNAIPDALAGDSASYTWQDICAIRFTASNSLVAAADPGQGVWDYTLPAFEYMKDVIEWHCHRWMERIFVLDVSPTLPIEILRNAHEIRSEFIGEELWNLSSSDEVVKGVIGPLIFSVGANWSSPSKFFTALKHALSEIEYSCPNNFYSAGISNHDTNPSPIDVTIPFWALTWLLPNSQPFIYSGSEHGSQMITNKEFGFSRQEQDNLDYDNLALFSLKQFDYESSTLNALFLKEVATIIETRRILKHETSNNYRIKLEMRYDQIVSVHIQDSISDDTLLTVVYNCGFPAQNYKIDSPFLSLDCFNGACKSEDSVRLPPNSAAYIYRNLAFITR